jgi:hypothetical protein
MSGTDDMRMDDAAPSATTHGKGGTQEDARPSPHPAKNMKVDETGAYLSKPSRSTTRRVTNKSGKTQ